MEKLLENVLKLNVFDIYDANTNLLRVDCGAESGCRVKKTGEFNGKIQQTN